ncbi:hypothetical protein RSAG8_12124, partial [Rhizoctonia solani AG-8 WAC10335]
MSVWNDELRSRFPSGIGLGRILCCANVSEDCWSCSTTYESNGSVISREICLSEDPYWDEWWIHLTKQFIYYKALKPIWTQILNSSPSQTQDSVTSASALPVGMHCRELKKYQGLPMVCSSGNVSVLVWKTYLSGGGRGH